MNKVIAHTNNLVHNKVHSCICCYSNRKLPPFLNNHCLITKYILTVSKFRNEKLQNFSKILKKYVPCVQCISISKIYLHHNQIWQNTEAMAPYGPHI